MRQHKTSLYPRHNFSSALADTSQKIQVVSVGFSLWHPSGNADEVTESWLKEQADIINSRKADINTINGYTVINVHPWTVGPDDLQYFISQLNDNIEVIGIEELLSAVKQNIPHKSAIPG